MNQKKRWIAMILCVLFLVLPIAAEYFVIQNTDHVCTKKECPVCEELHLAAVMLKVLSSCLVAKTAALFLAILSFSWLTAKFVLYLKAQTLITLKVELLD